MGRNDSSERTPTHTRGTTTPGRPAGCSGVARPRGRRGVWSRGHSVWLKPVNDPCKWGQCHCGHGPQVLHHTRTQTHTCTYLKETPKEKQEKQPSYGIPSNPRSHRGSEGEGLLRNLLRPCTHPADRKYVETADSRWPPGSPGSESPGPSNTVKPQARARVGGGRRARRGHRGTLTTRRNSPCFSK